MENTMLTNIMYATIYVTDQDRALEFFRTRGLPVRDPRRGGGPGRQPDLAP
ncbi:hypothetical protein ACQPW1_28525 [Nocardia sp. CA-128927]|uniref:hypothetical protein n=1 Tax=Nocardia sp. CA-128927 TaxID=3239975 RepID=UPI003D966107